MELIQVKFILVLQTLEQVEKTEGYLMDRILMQVIFSLAKAGYPQHIEDIKGRIRFERELIPGMSLVPTAGWRENSFFLFCLFFGLVWFLFVCFCCCWFFPSFSKNR